MGKILLLYHSGSGCTKSIGEIFISKLAASHEIEMLKIHCDFDYSRLLDYDFIIIGFPTYYWEPSAAVSEFVSKMPVYERSLKAFVYTTYGLYNGNSLRILIKRLHKKNVISVAHTEIKGPASDHIIFPFSTPSMFEYDRHLSDKIEKSVQQINRLARSKENSLKVPPFKWYVPINNINKYPGKKLFYHYRDKMHVLENRCTNCKICITHCESNNWTEGEKHPEYIRNNCEFCLRCVHNCPAKAIVFSDKMRDRTRFDKKFYSASIKEYLTVE